MHLVMFLAACLLGVELQGAPCSPPHAAVARQFLAADTGGLADAASPGDVDDPLRRWQPFIREASRRFGIPESWIRAVMAAESAGQQMLGGHPITSSTGAMGLMQVMPETYAEMRRRHGLGADPYDPRDNILAGTAYLRLLYDRYGYPGFFAAYNAGPGRFDDYRLRGIPLPDETRHYLLAINPALRKAIDAERPEAAKRHLDDTPRTAAPPSANALFFPLGTVPATSARAAMGMAGGHVSTSDSGRLSPNSEGLFVPLPSTRRATE